MTWVLPVWIDSSPASAWCTDIAKSAGDGNSAFANASRSPTGRENSPWRVARMYLPILPASPSAKAATKIFCPSSVARRRNIIGNGGGCATSRGPARP